ncbi:MAG: OmpA family protein [Bacteroidetes bacterium]|nr:OmpA family protein [Bacteroidota bacterium]
MKKFLAFLLIFSVFNTAAYSQILKKLGQKINDKVNQRVDNKTDQTIDKGLDKTEDATKKKDNSGNSKDNNNDSNSNNTNAGSNAIAGPPSLKSYQNYDFVPGDTVLFADDFTDDQDGEFPAHWTLSKGQAVMNKAGDKPAFFLTEGNYCQVNPRMKNTSYLTDPFTIEFDYYANDGYGPNVSFNYKDKDGNDAVGYIGYNTLGTVATFELPADFSASYPNANADTYKNKWHHAALIYKNNQVKCYIDQYRILVIPNLNVIPTSFGFAGIGDLDNAIIITNVRAASGGNMNMIGKKFTEAKIVTHGITFDIDKSNLKPESMGTLNMIVGVLKSNPDIKFEIDGHTDNTGNATHNMTLSQQRADAVKAQLEKMGIDGARLSTKGFGDTKPISDNDSPEGRANNRRVEFVKM